MRDDSDPDGGGSGGGMEGCYMPNNPAHYGLDGGWSIGGADELSLPTLDLDPLPSLFPFSPCSGATAPQAPYKSEFSTLITKNGEEVGVKQPHDMADVLLSLKHAVVHPGQTCATSPFSYSYASSPYSVHPHQMMPVSPGAPSYPDGNGCNSGAPNYNLDSADLCVTGNGAASWSTNTHQSPVFPSMSVNVSMNMTMHGYPPAMNEHQIACPQMQWITVPATPGSGSPNYQSQGLLSPHSGSYGTGATYSFTTDFRPPNQGTIDQPFSIYTNPLGDNCGGSGGPGDGGETTPTYRPMSPISPMSMSPSNLNSSTPNHVSYNISISPHNDMSPILTGSTSPCSKMSKRHDGGKVSQVNQHPVQLPPLPLPLHHECTNNENSVERPNLCRICGKTYARPSTLKTHLRTHSGEKPYRCEDCNKSFSQAANLTAHVRTHSGEKPFKCNICDRRFSQSSSVTTHMRTHSGERPYRCRLCRKAFSDSSTLTKHLRIHSGEKPYQCKLCLLRFSQSGNLNRHMRVHGQHYVIPM